MLRALIFALLAMPMDGAPPPAHPDIGQVTGDCLSCHRSQNPEIAADWEASKHGSRNVPCVSCHGAVGANFLRKPGAGRCVACHAEMVDTLKTPLMKGKNCWTCHVPHRLNPHVSLWKTGPEEAKKK
jgi:hypothetical protein